MEKNVKIKFVGNGLKIPAGVFRSNGMTFECRVCGAVWERDTLDNRIDCPYCGGKRTAIRQDD